MERGIIEKVLDKMKQELTENQLRKLSEVFDQVMAETFFFRISIISKNSFRQRKSKAALPAQKNIISRP